MDMYTAVKYRIIELCGKKNMTVNKLANHAGISPSTLKSILYGNSKNPGIVTLKMIFDGLGVSVKEFFDTDVFDNLEQEIK